MKPPSFHVASPEEIKQGEVTDVYFLRALEVLQAKGLDRRTGWAEFTVGRLPAGWPWGVFCGLEEVLSLLEGLPVNAWALPEGTLFPARDPSGVRVPVLAVKGPYGRFMLHETPILGMICQATGVATRTARIRLAAGKAALLGFGTRRMHPAIAPMLDRASFIGGCDGVSNVAGARALGLPPRGTMPHALIVAFGSAERAWAAFDEVLPKGVPRIALVDTYSDEKEEALRAAQLLGKRLRGVRLDTPDSRRGNMPELVREVRWELDLRGFRHVQIFVSGGLDEGGIPALLRAGAAGFGVGTAIANAPTVDFSMDLVEMEGQPRAKRSRLGGKKMPWACGRCLGWQVLPGMRAARGPACPGCRGRMRPMLRLVLKGGRRTALEVPPAAIRSYLLKQLSRAQRSAHA